jgi:hypothetical protein
MMTGEIQVGDLVLYRPEPITHGTLPYFKHVARRRQLLSNKLGIVIDQHHGTLLVLFGNDPITCKKEDLDLASPNN